MGDGRPDFGVLADSIVRFPNGKRRPTDRTKWRYSKTEPQVGCSREWTGMDANVPIPVLNI